MTKHLQLSEQGRLKHFLTIEGLSTELLTEILDTAESFVDMSEHRV
ncbi:MAG: aspartate carbamoyltransferase catalytic subunit, partial [Methylococcaceae bacterium]|nr:aspartate carbamoyltransferase catalytic subunit [Methylococcaceae bacterium]